VHIGTNLGAAFERLEARIRERAYELFTGREPEAGDPMTDWLNAEMELLTPVDLTVKERKHYVQVEGHLKGFKPADIEVEVAPGELRVCGTHEESARSEKKGVARSSRNCVHFLQVVPLPCDVELDGSEARLLKNGKLSIKLPKVRAA